MIARVSGRIEFKGERFVVVDSGGVGYEVYLPTGALKTCKLDEEVSLWTYLAVREDALDLYGFLERRELEFFKLLLSVPGIGPKSALAILSLAPPETLQQAIAQGDAAYLTKVFGLGKRSAEKIIVELKDKLAALPPGEPRDFKEAQETLEALQALGYGLREAREALQKVDGEAPDTVGKIKAALKFLSQK